MKAPWLARFKSHPKSCAGHILWAAIGGGYVGGAEGAALGMGGGWAYQFGSAWRKQDTEGRVDTVGLDAFDYPVGYLIGLVIRRILESGGNPWLFLGIW